PGVAGAAGSFDSCGYGALTLSFAPIPHVSTSRDRRRSTRRGVRIRNGGLRRGFLGHLESVLAQRRASLWRQALTRVRVPGPLRDYGARARALGGEDGTSGKAGATARRLALARGVRRGGRAQLPLLLRRHAAHQRRGRGALALPGAAVHHSDG